MGKKKLAEPKRTHIKKTFVDNLQRDPSQNVIWWDTDCLGFGVRVSRGGCKAYVFQYLVGGKQRRITLGKHGTALTADQARKIAQRRRLAVQNGADPAAEAKESREAPTVRDLAERYLAEHAAKRSASTRRNSELLFRLHLLPVLGSRPVKSITWNDLDSVARKLAEKHPVTANRLLSVVSKAFSYAQRWQWFPRDAANPGREHDRNPERRRGMALDRVQLGRVGAALGEEADPFAVAAYRLTLLCGGRPGEIVAAQWKDIDLQARVWRLPEAKTGGRTVYLGEAAARVLAGLPQTGVWVFPGSGQSGHLQGLRHQWERIAARADLPKGVRLYDATRHTFATTAEELEIPRDVAFRLTGHSGGSAAGDRYRHGTRILLRAADTVSGWLAAALEGESEPAAEVLHSRA
jgi:integrase